MLGGLGDASTLIALRLVWCINERRSVALWTRLFAPLLEAAWVETDVTGYGMQALLKVTDADLAWLCHAWRPEFHVRLWSTIGGERLPGCAVLWAQPGSRSPAA
jgi:hypothetical protein